MKVLAVENPSCFYLDPAFYEKLSTTKESHTVIFRWFKTFNPVTHDKVRKFVPQIILNPTILQIFVPIHYPGHWCLVILDLRMRRVEYYDSLSSKRPGGDANKACRVRFSRSWISSQKSTDDTSLFRAPLRAPQARCVASVVSVANYACQAATPATKCSGLRSLCVRVCSLSFERQLRRVHLQCPGYSPH